MNIRRLLLPLVTLFLGSSQYLAAADAPAVPTKPGYNVVLDVAFNEEGVGEEAKIIESDDPTGDLILNTIAMHLAADVKQPKKMMTASL